LKAFFFATFLLLAALSGVAWKIAPDRIAGNKTTLIWCSDDNPLRRAQMNPFNQLYPQYQLQLDPANTFVEKIIVQSLAGVGPDLFDCYSPTQLVAFVRSGIAWDVTDELAKMNIDVRAETWGAVHPDCIVDGRIYGVPVNAAANAIWYHKDLTARQNVTLPDGPWTWDQLLPLAQKLTLRDPRSNKVTQWGLFIDWDPNYKQFIRQWGGRMFSEGGARCTIDSPECIAAIQFMHDLIYRYQVSPRPSDEDAMSAAGGWGSARGSSITFFGAERGAMALGGRWWLCRLRDKDYTHLKLGAAQSPCGKLRVFLGYGKATLINKNSPHRADALKFLQYLTTPQYNRLINHQADGVAPIKRYVNADEFLHDPDYPNEDFNQVWRDMMLASIPEETSPFINGSVAQRHIIKQLDLIRADSKPVDAALRDAAKIINETIAENVRVIPDLRARYDALMQ